MIKFTTKQVEILQVIKAGNPDGTACSVYDILKGITYECKRDAMLHSIRVLVDNGYVERKGLVNRDGKAVRIFNVTTKAMEIL
jgi:hypothetical protein